MTEESLDLFFQKKLMVIQWMEEILKVSINPNLCESLKSGVILCSLAKSIDDDLIPTIHDPKHVYKQIENVNMFLDVCKEFHIPLMKIPSIEDFEKNNIVRIVECLFLFGIECMKEYDIPQFPKVSIEEARKAYPPENELQTIIQQLKLNNRSVIGGKIRISAEVFRRTLQYLMSQNKEFDLEVYENTISKAQAYFRRFKNKNEMQALKKKNLFRVKVTQEMIKTETDYVNYLKEGINKYMPIIKKFIDDKIIKEDSLKLIFNNLEEIQKFNNEFLTQLTSKTKDMKANSQWIDVYQLLEKCSEVYTPYLVNYSLSIERVEQIQCIECVREALLKEKGKDKDISSYLIMPIQRLPRYVLLLNELRKHTWSDHPDSSKLDEMIALVKRVTTEINEKKSKADNERKLPVLLDTYKPIPNNSQFKKIDLSKECILYETSFYLKKEQISAVVSTSYLSFAIKGNMIKWCYPINMIDVLRCESKDDSIKIKIGKNSKLKVRGTKQDPDHGLIRMIENMKKTQVAKSNMNTVYVEPPKEVVAQKQNQLKPLTVEINRSVNAEEELINRRKTMKGRMSVYVKREKQLTIEEMNVNENLITTTMLVGKKRSMSGSKLIVNSIDTSIVASRNSKGDGSSGSMTPIKLSPKVSSRQTIAVARTNSASPRFTNPMQRQTGSPRPNSPLQKASTDGFLKQSIYGGNNDLTRNMLRERTVTLVDGKRPVNSLGNEIYSFSELERKPSGSDKEDLVFHLSDDDFVQLFDVTFETFKTWKGWKQQGEKQKAGLW